MTGEYRWGIDLYNNGYYWEAHEAWESLWRQTSSLDRDFLQGLIQCAGAALKLAMGEPGQRLANKGLGRLRRVAAVSAVHWGLDVIAFADAFDAALAAGREPPFMSLE